MWKHPPVSWTSAAYIGEKDHKRPPPASNSAPYTGEFIVVQEIRLHMDMYWSPVRKCPREHTY